ncbi:MAG: hypothetical protein AB1665_02205 [Candidatus Thermoplasmatota archaeon]
MEFGIWEFATIFILMFSLCVFVAGIFTAYFGSGKSRKIGGGLIALGIVIGFIWTLLSTRTLSKLIGMEPVIPLGDTLLNVVIQAAIVIIGAALGALAAIGVFLLAIMKS